MNLRVFAISTFVAVSMVLVSSCQNEEIEIQNETEEISFEQIETENQILLKTFLADLKEFKSKSSEITSGNFNFDTDEGKELFLAYFSSYKVVIDQQVFFLDALDGHSTLQMYFDTLDKLSSFDEYDHNYRINGPTLEEIRDALMQECDTYVALLAKPCQVAVLIAYGIKKI